MFSLCSGTSCDLWGRSAPKQLRTDSKHVKGPVSDIQTGTGNTHTRFKEAENDESLELTVFCQLTKQCLEKNLAVLPSWEVAVRSSLTSERTGMNRKLAWKTLWPLEALKSCTLAPLNNERRWELSFVLHRFIPPVSCFIMYMSNPPLPHRHISENVALESIGASAFSDLPELVEM